MDMSGMDTTMDNSTTMSMMTHFTTELGMANLWFNSWTPNSAGATFGACAGLFFLALFSRILAVVQAGAAQAWHDSLLLEREALAARAVAASGSRAGSESSASSTDGTVEDVLAKSSSLSPSASTSSPDPSAPTQTPTLAKSATLAPSRRELAVAPPFRLAHDLPRGLLFMFSSFVNYLLMLAVMTYGVWFLVAVLLGLGAGECLFGRFAPKHPHDALH